MEYSLKIIVWHPSAPMTSPDDMYRSDNEGTKEPPAKTIKSTKSRKGDSAREVLPSKERQLQDIIRSLEQEVIKLQLENSHLSVTNAGLG